VKSAHTPSIPSSIDTSSIIAKPGDYSSFFGHYSLQVFD